MFMTFGLAIAFSAGFIWQQEHELTYDFIAIIVLSIGTASSILGFIHNKKVKLKNI